MKKRELMFNICIDTPEKISTVKEVENKPWENQINLLGPKKFHVNKDKCL